MGSLKRTPIKARSNRMQTTYRLERVPIVKAMLDEFPICQRCQREHSHDIHELKSRARGGSITDKSNLVAVCRPCHTWITQNPKQALEQGWLKNSWDE